MNVPTSTEAPNETCVSMNAPRSRDSVSEDNEDTSLRVNCTDVEQLIVDPGGSDGVI